MVVKDQDAKRLEVVIARESDSGEEIMHGLVKLDADGGILMVNQEENARAFFLPHADLDVFRDFEQRMEVASLAQPRNQIMIEMLVTHGA